MGYVSHHSASLGSPGPLRGQKAPRTTAPSLPGLLPFLRGESVLLAACATLAAGGLSSSVTGRGGAAAPRASMSSSITSCISDCGWLWAASSAPVSVGDWSLKVSEDSLWMAWKWVLSKIFLLLSGLDSFILCRED